MTFSLLFFRGARAHATRIGIGPSFRSFLSFTLFSTSLFPSFLLSHVMSAAARFPRETSLAAIARANGENGRVLLYKARPLARLSVSRAGPLHTLLPMLLSIHVYIDMQLRQPASQPSTVYDRIHASPFGNITHTQTRDREHSNEPGPSFSF